MAEDKRPKGRPPKVDVEKDLYLKGEAQQIESCLNKLEELCKKPNMEKKDEFMGLIGLLVGKTMVHFTNIEREINIYQTGS